ncbi:MAG: hypothetical protein BWY10_02351 [Chloroflexi bacterium ADurb.Bin180]|nr:MAG: hypothetical protein BWY10_02351 [Chloroflexi bacterium ADurb.Bin180]
MFRPRRFVPVLVLLLVLPLAAPFVPSMTRAVTASSSATYTFSGTVYLGVESPQALSGVTLTLYTSDRPDTLGAAHNTAVSSSHGTYTLSYTTLGTYTYWHIVETPLAGYTPLRSSAGAGGEEFSATWIRYQSPSTFLHSGNDFYNAASATPTPTVTATRTQTPTPTFASTPTASPSPTDKLQCIEICAVADTYLEEEYPTHNNGSDDYLVVEGKLAPLGGLYRHQYTLLRFDLGLVPHGYSVQSASLMLDQLWSGGDASATLSLYPLTSAWDEGTATWASQPSMGGSAVAQAVSGSGPRVLSWNVTSVVNSWLSGAWANHGLAVRSEFDAGNWKRIFSSREGPGTCPRLQLCVGASHPLPTTTSTRTPTRTRAPAPTPTASATFECPAENSGDSFESAVVLTGVNQGLNTRAFICPHGDQDWWKVSAQAGDTIRAWLDDLPSDYALFLYRPNHSLAEWSSSDASDESLEFVADASGDWRLMVQGRLPANWSASLWYHLRANVCPGVDEDGIELKSGVAQTGYLCGRGDEDWYTYRVPDAQGIYLHAYLHNLPGNYDLQFRDPHGYTVYTCNNPGTMFEEINLPVSSNPGLWQLGVIAPGGDYSAVQPYELVANLGTFVDLTVRRIEVTQAIQRADANSVPLVEGKPAIIRIYVGTGQTQETIENVSVELMAWSSDAPGVPLPGSPLLVGPGAVPHEDLLQQRLNPNTLSVLLPDAWQLPYSPGRKLVLMATVKAAPSQPELNTANNTRIETAYFLPGRSQSIMVAQISYAGCPTVSFQDPRFAASLAYMEDLYPVSHVDWYLFPSGKPILTGTPLNIPGVVPGGCGQGWSNLLNLMIWQFYGVTGMPYNWSLYGLIDDCVPGGGGCGQAIPNVAAGYLGGVDIMAHEVGHNMNLVHAPCGDVGDYDAGFPHYANPGGGEYPWASIGEVGVRLRGGLTLFDPARTYDIMSYCGGDPTPWISPYNYWNLSSFEIWQASADRTAADLRQVIAVGQVLGPGALQLQPLWVRTMPDQTTGAGSGPYHVEVQDAGGGELASGDFAPDHHESASPDAGAFAAVLPYPQNAARVVFSYQGQVLQTISASPHAPTVTITYPVGGEVWAASGTYTVTWQQSDADGDALLSNVLYSPDHGATWAPAAVNITGTTLAVDAAELAGGGQALFRVEVNDGLNTTSATSGAVRVPNKPPLVLVLSPASDTVVPPGRIVLLHGIVTDREDGPLSGAGLTWSSDRDGPLGSGANVAAPALSRGWHTITVTAHDSDGLSGSAAVRVLVGQRMWLPAVIKRR